MALPLEKFIQQLEDSGIVDGETLKDFIPPLASPKDAEELALELVRQKKLTKFQAEEISKGKGKSLTLGNYVLMEKIGAGGMGQVFKARHQRMDRLVAVKLLPAAMTKDAAAIARFEREVKAAAKLRHPNIIAADDADQANGVHFLVMELVEGSDLSALVKKNGPLPLDKAVNYILQAAKGLEFAHAEGVIHRDIKPANLLLDKKGTVKILDMGLARIQGDISGQAELTGTGTVMGTVDYMAPEQAVDTKSADARADIYALGCSLFYLLTGKSTYEGDTLMNRLLAHRDKPIPRLRAIRSEVPERVETIFKRMVAKNVEDRFQTMTAVIADLERCSGQLSSTTVDVPSVTENIQFTSPPYALDGQPTTTMKGIQPRQASATLTAEDVASEATMLTGDALKFTNPQTQSLAASMAGRSSVVQQKSAPPAWWKNRRMQIGSGLAALLILLAGIVVSLKTKHGTLVVEVDQPDAMVQVLDADGKVEISQKGGSGKVTISVDPGKHRLKVEKDGFTTYGQEFEMDKGGTKAITAKLLLVDEKPATEAVASDKPWNKPIFQKWMKDVAAMPPEKQVEAVSKRMMELNPGFDGGFNEWNSSSPSAKIENGLVVELRCPTDHVTDISPLRALVGLSVLNCEGFSPATGALTDLSPLKGMAIKKFSCANNPKLSNLAPLKEMPLVQLHCGYTQVSDLSPLHGMKLTTLNVSQTQVSDISPLKGMKLAALDMPETNISDLSPLNGMPLTFLQASGAKVSDLSHLKGMPLAYLHVNGKKITDFSPLMGMPLGNLLLDFDPIRHTELLRSIKTLEVINGKLAAEFWKEVEEQQDGKKPDQ